MLFWPFRHVGFGLAANVAVTDTAPVIVSLHPLFPEQPPLQATKREPGAGLATSVATELRKALNAQTVVHDAWCEVPMRVSTEPRPRIVTVRSKDGICARYGLSERSYQPGTFAR